MDKRNIYGIELAALCKLDKQAFRKTACSDARWIEHLNDIKRLLKLKLTHTGDLGKLLERAVHIAGRIKAADEDAALLQLPLVKLLHLAELIQKIFGKGFFA